MRTLLLDYTNETTNGTMLIEARVVGRTMKKFYGFEVFEGVKGRGAKEINAAIKLGREKLERRMHDQDAAGCTGPRFGTISIIF